MDTQSFETLEEAAAFIIGVMSMGGKAQLHPIYTVNYSGPAALEPCKRDCSGPNECNCKPDGVEFVYHTLSDADNLCECGRCGANMYQVKPGKWQCADCD